MRVIHSATGVASHAIVRGGRFFVQGIEVGGPYVVEVRSLGFVPRATEPLFLTLGEPLHLHIAMQRVAVRLEPVFAFDREAAAPGGGGTATLIPASLVQRLPTLNRNFYDFVRLAPQVSTKVGSQRTGVSAAGANFRFNNFLINGADERFVNGNVAAGHNVGKSIPMDAVREFQVLVAPYDVRYGDFAGALVNTVSQSGTNELHGSAFTYWRSDRLARGGDLASGAPYQRFQYGLSLGGPIVRDRIHFFIAPELQHLTSPAAGPYVGQPSSRAPVPVAESDLQRLDEVMRARGLSAGSSGLVRIDNPLRNVFARLDAAIPAWSSRAVAFVNYVGAQDPRFSRSSEADTFSLSSYNHSAATGVRLLSLQLHTDLPSLSGGHNELTISQLSDWVDFLPAVRQPIVRVLVPGRGGGLVVLNTGTAEMAQGRFDRSWSVTIKDEISIPLRARHVLVAGVQLERFRVKRGGVTGGYGTWTFSSLDLLEQGLAERYELRKDLGSADAPLPGLQYAAYGSDEWHPSDRLSITTGLRLDLMDLRANAPLNADVHSIFGRRTDEMPRERVHVSPRLGFAWDVFGTGRDKLRGGVGMFTGRPPRGWLRPAITNYGVGIGQLKCGSLLSDHGAPPAFVADYRQAPTACANGQGVQTIPQGDVDLLDRNLRMARALRGSVAWDRRLPGGVTATTEALVSRYLSDFKFVNLNLRDPLGTDRFGRVLYGTTSPAGVPAPAPRSAYAGVIDLVNTSRNYSYQLSTRMERRFTRGTAASASYTYSRTRDVQSPSRVNQSGTAMWADARAVSGRHDDPTLGISLNDLPHRAVAAFTYAAPWQRWPTEIALSYVGESGSPFTYTAWGTGKFGDLNSDGSNSNDPIYVPTNAAVATEIAFSGRSAATDADNTPATQALRVLDQQLAFEQFIERTTCLRRQRGRILERNSCREPWSQTTIVALRQVISAGRHRPEVALDVFNLPNLLNGGWGRYRVAVPRVLEQVAPEGTAQPTFRFNTTHPSWFTLRAESAFQLQLGVRYRF